MIAEASDAAQRNGARPHKPVLERELQFGSEGTFTDALVNGTWERFGPSCKNALSRSETPFCSSIDPPAISGACGWQKESIVSFFAWRLDQRDETAVSISVVDAGSAAVVRLRLELLTWAIASKFAGYRRLSAQYAVDEPDWSTITKGIHGKAADDRNTQRGEASMSRQVRRNQGGMHNIRAVCERLS